jgi:hypothetical protein
MIKIELGKYRSIRCLLFILTLIAIPIFVAGCGGSSGDSSPPATTYNLYDPLKFTSGYSETGVLSGTDTDGFSYTGAYSIETRDIDTINGQVVIPVVTNLSFTTLNPDIGNADSEETAYYIDSSTPHSIESGSVVYEPDAGMISELPATGVIGASGTLTSWTGDDGSSFSGTWVVEDGGNSLADVAESYTFRNTSGDIESTQEIVLTVNSAGEPQKIYIVLDYPAPLDVTITLEGDLN